MGWSNKNQDTKNKERFNILVLKKSLASDVKNRRLRPVSSAWWQGWKLIIATLDMDCKHETLKKLISKKYTQTKGIHF